MFASFPPANTLKNSLEITQRENYITIGFKRFAKAYRMVFDAQQKDDESDAHCTAHMLFFWRKRVQTLTERKAPMAFVCVPFFDTWRLSCKDSFEVR
jgi:hypothetical protein